jgi:hypothetical protein
MPALLTSLDVCVIPHLVNELTLSMDPIKIYDYMATGRPIVSTGVAGVDRFDDVIYVRHDLDGFLDGIESALRENDNVRRQRLIYAQENTWSKRGSEIWRIMEDVLAKRENGQLCGKRHRN